MSSRKVGFWIEDEKWSKVKEESGNDLKGVTT